MNDNEKKNDNEKNAAAGSQAYQSPVPSDDASALAGAETWDDGTAEGKLGEAPRGPARKDADPLPQSEESAVAEAETWDNGAEPPR